MDRVIQKFPYLEDGDLNLCLEHGVAYQRDMSQLVPYDADYWKNYVSREGTAIARELNRGRVDFVEHHYRGELLDIGVGSGEFIKSRPLTFGYDVNPVANQWLLENGKYSEDFDKFSAFTMWDVLEHIENPVNYFINFSHGSFLFVSIPIFSDLKRVRESRHYKPGEHLYYWTEDGLIKWMADYGFQLRAKSNFETRAGRASIMSYAFRVS